MGMKSPEQNKGGTQIARTFDDRQQKLNLGCLKFVSPKSQEWDPFRSKFGSPEVVPIKIDTQLDFSITEADEPLFVLSGGARSPNCVELEPENIKAEKKQKDEAAIDKSKAKKSQPHLKQKKIVRPPDKSRSMDKSFMRDKQAANSYASIHQNKKNYQSKSPARMPKRIQDKDTMNQDRTKTKKTTPSIQKCLRKRFSLTPSFSKQTLK